MKTTWRLLPSIVAVTLLTAGVVTLRMPAQADSLLVLPDLQTVIPEKDFAIVDTPQGREFQYTHLVYDAGPGPLEVQPHYSENSGSYQGEQLTYKSANPTSDPGTWDRGDSKRVADIFTYHAAHGHFHFPLASFGLYADDNGKPGVSVAPSPKIGFCIDDSYVYNKEIPNAGRTVRSRGACSDPDSLRGLSIGGADEYNRLDPGQSIPFPSSLKSGIYWFKAMTDPNNDFLEADEANNEVDVKIRIDLTKTDPHDRVVPLQTVEPDTTPPTGSLSAPAEGAVLKGNSTLVAASGSGLDLGSSIDSVSFLVDGVVVGTRDSSPYTYDLDTTTLVDGTHWFAARITDTLGRTGTTAVHQATVANAPADAGGDLQLVSSVVVSGQRTKTVALTNLQAGDRLVALIGGDGLDQPGQKLSVTSGSAAGAPTWSLAKRSNTGPGTTEAWTAVVGSGTSSATVTASLDPAADFNLSGMVMVFRGSAGIGAVAAASGTSATQSVQLTPQSQGSMVFGVGLDWTHDAARSVPGDQDVVHQQLIPGNPDGDTFWIQRQRAVTAQAAQAVTLSATSPAAGKFNLTAIEIKTTSPGDRSAPRVSVTDPFADTTPPTLTGNARLAATAADNVKVARVDFLVDGSVVGSATAPPYAVVWSSKSVTKGPHVVTALAYDAAGNVGRSSPVDVLVDNSARPPSRISIDQKAVADTTGTESRSPGTMTATISTKSGRHLLLALVAQDGPEGGEQGTTVTSDGLTWTLVKQLDSQTGAAGIWSAVTSRGVSNLRVTATPTAPGYSGHLTVLSLTGAAGTGVPAAAGLQDGSPSVYLPGVGVGSWVVAVGDDPDAALTRGLPAEQLISESISTQRGIESDTGATFWVQGLPAQTTISGLVTITTPGPTTHQWNVAAVEIKPNRAPRISATDRLLTPNLPNPGIRPPIPGHHG